MEIAFLKTDEEWEDLAELIGQVFGPGDRSLWENFHGREPFCRRDCCLVARENGRMVSHICWVPRSIRIGTAAIQAGAIGYTVTDPAYRGRGLAAALMNSWKDHLSARGEHLSFIVGIPSFYERFGYEFAFPLDMRDAPVVIDGDEINRIDRQPLPAGTGKAFQYQPADLPDLAALYDRENAARTGSQVRTMAYWDWLLQGLQASGRLKLGAGQPADVWLVRDQQARARGYAFLRPGFQGGLEIWEAAAADEDAARTIINLAVELARRHGRQRIDLKLPLDHGIIRAALKADARLRGYSFGIFARILSLQGLFSALVPELERRLLNSPASGWEGTLRLETDIGELPLVIHKGRILTGHLTSPPGIAGPMLNLRIPQSLLVRLVTGYASVNWVAGALNMLRKASQSSAPLPDEALPVLEALFPKGVPYMWNADIGY